MDRDILKSPIVRFNLLKTAVMIVLTVGLAVAAVLSRRSGDTTAASACASLALGCVTTIIALWQHSGLPREGEGQPKPERPAQGA